MFQLHEEKIELYCTLAIKSVRIYSHVGPYNFVDDVFFTLYMHKYGIYFSAFFVAVETFQKQVTILLTSN